MKGLVAAVAVALALCLAACNPFTIKPVDYSWPIEVVAKVEKNGTAEVERYSLSFNVRGLLFEELADSTGGGNVSLRVIRDGLGYYYVTANHFKNVYVFKTGEGALEQKARILVAEKGLAAPAFNQRAPYIELLDGKAKVAMLTADGIHQEGGKK